MVWFINRLPLSDRVPQTVARSFSAGLGTVFEECMTWRGVRQRGSHKANRGKSNVDECRVKSSRAEGPRRRIKQGHGKGGGWNIGHDRGECARRRPGLRTSRREEQVNDRSEGMLRAIRGQSSAGRTAEGRTRHRAGSAGTNSAHGLWISRSLDEGKGRVIRFQRAGRRAAYRAGRGQEGQGDESAWVSLSGGQDRDKGE